MARRIKVFSIITLLISSFILGEIIPQTSQPDSILQKAKTLFQSVDNIKINNRNGVPQSVRGKLISNVNLFDSTQAKQFLRNSKSLFRLNDSTDDFVVKKISKDEINMTSAKLQQTYKGIPVWGSEMLLHGDPNNTIVEVNGRFTPDLNLTIKPSVSLEDALNIALTDLGPAEYRWQNTQQEKIIKQVFKDNNKTWKPNPELVVAPNKGNFDNNDYRIAWKMTIAVDGAKTGNWEYFIDAKTGEILNKFNSMPDAVGSGISNYNGTVTIYSHWASSTYQMIDTVRNIYTYNYNGTIPGTLLTDSDNYWDQNKSAVDVHWAIGKVYDFYKNIFNRTSFDNAGSQIVNTVNCTFSPYPNNASWTGSQMQYGAGDGTLFSSVTSLDVCGHELTHAVTQYTANLTYSGESGALNEAISDIFGTSIEFYATPQKANWLIGEDCYTPNISGDALRYMNNPNSGNQPDTYLGTYWASTSGGDNGGVHTNSGVLNYAFYLMTVGGSGTNDLGTTFNVTGIGLTKTRAIAYRALTVYLISSSQYSDAREAFLSSVSDIYGSSSAEYKTVSDAFGAVGIGIKLTVSNSFNAGTIMVNNSTQNSGYNYFITSGLSQTYQAIAQTSGSYNYVWNTNGVNASISYWKKQISGGQPSRITSATNTTYTYVVGSVDHNATYIADLKKNYTISRNDQTEFDGTSSAGVIGNIVEGNTGSFSAPTSKSINGRDYYFYQWSNGDLNNPKTVTPVDNTILTANYKGHMLSSLTSATGNNGQRTLVEDIYGVLHLVYQSNGEIWYTRSSDNGVTWTSEIRLSSGTGTAHNPAISDPSTYATCIFVIWVDNASLTPGYSIYSKKLHTDNWNWETTREITGITLDAIGYAKRYTKPAAISLRTPSSNYFCIVAFEDTTTSGISLISGSVVLNGNGDTWNYLGGIGSSTYNPSLYCDINHNKSYLAYDNSSDIYMTYWDMSAHPTSLYLTGTYTVSNSSYASPNTNPSVTADQTGRVHFSWKAFDHTQYYINTVFTRSMTLPNYSLSSLTEFAWYYPFDQPTICDHFDTDGGASLLFHSSNNYVYKVYSSNGTTWNGTAGNYPGIQVGNVGSYNPAVTSWANPTLVPYVWTTNSAAPYVIPFQKYNEVTHALAKEDANVPGSSSKKPVTFTASQSVLLSNSSGNDKYLINFSNLQFSKLNTTSLPVSLLANSGRNNSLISLNTDNTANSVSSSDGYTLSGSIKYSGQTTGTRIKVVLMDTVNNNIAQQLTALTISNPDELDAVNIQVPLNNGINLKNTAVKFLINGIIDTSFTSTLVNAYFLNDSTNVQAKQTAGLVETVPTEYALNQNYPNPFNPSTVIEYQLPKDGYVTLKVYDILGREVRTLVNGYKTVGKYSVSFDASKLASGIYIYELKSNDFSSIKKMILTK